MPLPHNWTLNEVVALSLVPRIKSVDLRNLVERYVSLEALLQAAPVEIHKARLTSDTLFASTTASSLLEAADKQCELCDTQNVRIISFWDDDYPALLKEIFYPPTLLYVRGRLQAPDAAAVAIVGTRRCTDYGKMVTEQYAEHFAVSGIVVVSGLATGVDTFAHKATLAKGGITYAVIASGIDKISPNISAQRAQEIAENGAVISEYPCGTVAQPAYFPRRNRIISGISQGTLVVESGERGGSLITAQFAIDQNRELFAVPGRIYSERSKGTNLLIQRSQAQLTLTPHDMLQTLGFAGNASVADSQSARTEVSATLNALENSIYKELDGDPIHIEALSTKTGLAVQDLLVILLELEFKGIVRQLAGKQFMRRS
jgi:DNA processing protein